MDRRRTTITISVIFALALFLGPGPASALVGGSRDSPNFLFGVPALYLWLVFWFFVMAACVMFAAVKLWSDD
jgi:hypothetical protein